ncbi:MAG: fumarate reductase subunit D [Proteobacteria bacterium]|nr:fumarate reductase subunit D [Pseudomonadota bacterium]
MSTRSNEPPFWGLFGFGGMVIAFAFPALLICMIIAGLSDGHSTFHITEVISHWWGAAALFIIIFGAAFHGVHRIYHSLNDLKIHTGILHRILLYGFAVCISIAAFAALLMNYIHQI